MPVNITQCQEEIDVLNQQAAALRSEKPQEALPFALEALKLSQSGPFAATSYTQGVAESLTNLAFAYNRLGKREQAFSWAMDALDLYESHKELTIPPTIYLTLGSIYMALSEYAEALTYYYRALDQAQQQEDRYHEASVLNHIGIIHNRLGDFSQVIEVSNQALALYRQLGDRSGQATIYNNQAMAYFALKAYDNALEHAQRALKVAEEIGHIRLTTSIHATIGEIYIEVKTFDKAEHHLQISRTLAQENQIAYIEMYSQLMLGKVRNQQQQPEEALPFLHVALAKAKEISVREDTAVCYEAIAQSYKLLGDFEQALAHFEAYHHIQHEIFNEESDQRLRNLQVVHQTRTAQQEAEIYQLRNVALHQEIADRQRVEAALQEANAQLQRQNEELDAYAHTVAHDLKQPLTAVAMYADMITQYGDQLEENQREQTLLQMKRASERAVRIVDELLLLATIRHKEIELRPLDMSAILQNVQQRLAPMFMEHNVSLTLSTHWPSALGYAPWIEEVWANYLTNAVKYGGQPPTIICGAETLTNHNVKFWVKDNGQGLSESAKNRLFTPFNQLDKEGFEGYGLGLSIVKRIITRLGGNVGMESTPDAGSRFYFTLPT